MCIGIDLGTPSPPSPQLAPIEETTTTAAPSAVQEDASVGNEQIGKKQNNLNIYFMKELKKLKGDQKRLDDEVLHLKLENSNLTSRLKTSQWQVMRLMEYFSQMADQQQGAQIPTQRALRALDAVPAVTGSVREATSVHGAHPGIPHLGATAAPKGRAEQPMVVYDLSKSTATVLTANTTFCQMVGYELNEVIGMPWTEFIPQEAARRTMNTILQQKNISSVIQLDQVYKHRTGGLFVMYDTHTILFGNDGMPISDFVTLHFPDSNPSGAPNPPPALPPMKFLSNSAANLSPASIQPLSSPASMAESPSDDEYECDPMISGASSPMSISAIGRPHSAPVFTPKPSGAMKGQGAGRSLTPQAGAATTIKKSRRPKAEQTGAPVKLRDNFPKASMSVLDEDEDEGPYVQQTPFDEVLARNSYRWPPQPTEGGPTSIFHMPPSSNFPSLTSPFPTAASPFPPSPTTSSSSTSTSTSAYTAYSASPPAFSFDDTPMGSSSPTSSPSSSSSMPSLYSRAPSGFFSPLSGSAAPIAATASQPSFAAPHNAGPNAIPLPPALLHNHHHQQQQQQAQAQSSADIASVEDALNELDLDHTSFMPFSLDDDFLNSLLAPQPSGGANNSSTSGGGDDSVRQDE